MPKESGWAGARMSVTLRHSREGWWAARGQPEGATGKGIAREMAELAG